MQFFPVPPPWVTAHLVPVKTAFTSALMTSTNRMEIPNSASAARARKTVPPTIPMAETAAAAREDAHRHDHQSRAVGRDQDSRQDGPLVVADRHLEGQERQCRHHAKGHSESESCHRDAVAAAPARAAPLALLAANGDQGPGTEAGRHQSADEGDHGEAENGADQGGHGQRVGTRRRRRRGPGGRRKNASIFTDTDAAPTRNSSRHSPDWSAFAIFVRQLVARAVDSRGVLNLTTLLEFAVQTNASDIHLRANVPPRVRVDGQLQDVHQEVVSAADLEALIPDLLPADRAQEFASTNEADFAVSVAGLGRFRGNAFRQRGTVGIVLRRVRSSVASLKEMGLPPVVRKLADEPRGLVLVTGPTGSGKTTTLAAMVDHINATRAVNIMTIEDPIEVTHANKVAMIAQREIGTDTHDYPQAMRRVLRQDPDVILIGEMRDAETVAAALSAAETGHLVLSTLHTVNATETINRIIEFFPAFQHHQVRLTLAASLKGVVSQRLLERSDGRGRVPAVEVMVVTGRIADRIVDPDGGRGETIEEMIGDGEWYGMQTFDQSLVTLYRDGMVSLPQAMSNASKPHDFKLMLEKSGLVAAR